jgi:flagellar protein FliO/FliZ
MSGVHASDWLSFAGSFAFVLALLGLLLYVMKKMQSGSLLGMPQRRIRILESMSLGPRQKVVLLRVKDQDILVGITAQQMTTLANFAITPEELAASTSSVEASRSNPATPLAPLAQRFADLLKSAASGNQKNRDGN